MIRSAVVVILFVGGIFLFIHQMGQSIGQNDSGALATVCAGIDSPASAAFSPRPVERRQ